MFGTHRVKSICLSVGVLLFSGVSAQISNDIYYKYCYATPDTACFDPVNGAVDTVGRDVVELGGGYRFCFNINDINAGVKPIRVILVLDKSGSMCNHYENCCVPGDSSGMCAKNDPTNKRVDAANAFVDSLRAISPESEVGVLTYVSSISDYFSPVPLTSETDVSNIHRTIERAGCTNRGGIGADDEEEQEVEGGLTKTLGIKATNLGTALSRALVEADAGFENLPADMERHIILLTDGAWDDLDRLPPEKVYEDYRTQFPGRELPTVHGVFLSDSATHVQHGYPKEGCAEDNPVDLQYLKAASEGTTGGKYISGATPQTVVQEFKNLLDTLMVRQASTLQSMTVTNLTTGEVRGHKDITETISPDSTSAHYLATIDNLPLQFGLNSLIIKRIVNKSGSETAVDTSFDTVSIFRTDAWTTTVDPKEHEIFCTLDSTTIDIDVTPPEVLINNPFSVNATINLKKNFLLDTVQVRIFSQAADDDPASTGIFHLEGTLLNSVDGSQATGTGIAYSTIPADALFGKQALKAGTFTAGIAVQEKDFALEVWIKPLSTVSATDIFSFGGNAFGITADRKIFFRSADGATTVSLVAANANAWSHIAVSRINGNLLLYINGINVSEQVSFTTAVSGDVSIMCPPGAFLDEVRISNTGRNRADSEAPFLRFDIPVLDNATWTLSGTAPSTGSEIILAPGMWNGGNVGFQFSSPIPGRYVVNFQHKGTAIETQWSENGNPVTAEKPEAPSLTITVTPDTVSVNQPFSVDAKVGLTENTILDNFYVRVFTEFPDNPATDMNTVAVLHLEGNLVNSIDDLPATKISESYTTTEALFGKSALDEGSFNLVIGAIQGDFAIETWIKPSNTVTETEIFSFGGNSFGISADRTLFFKTADGTAVASGPALDVNEWSHIAVSRSAGSLVIFINGINVSGALAFTAALSSPVAVNCPEGAILDEMRISRTGRRRSDSGDPFLRLDIPSVQEITWIMNGTQSTSPVLTLTPADWKNQTVDFQFTSPVAGRLVVNFQHNGTRLETQMSKNGNPVYARADSQGPWVEWGKYFIDLEGGRDTDTLLVRFTEAVMCTSVIGSGESHMPENIFRILQKDGTWKTHVLSGAVFKETCLSDRIQEVTILLKPTMNGILPESDSIQIVGPVVDTAGNLPDTSKLGPILRGNRGNLVMTPIKTDGMEIPEAFRFDIPETHGKVIMVETANELEEFTLPDGRKSYARTTVIYDVVGNIVATDVPLKRFQNDLNKYYVVWEGKNRSNRRVGSGSYLFYADVRYKGFGNPNKLQKKFTIRWKKG